MCVVDVYPDEERRRALAGGDPLDRASDDSGSAPAWRRVRRVPRLKLVVVDIEAEIQTPGTGEHLGGNECARSVAPLSQQACKCGRGAIQPADVFADAVS